MVEAMVLGGLRRNETLGLRFEDLKPGEKRIFVADGKGGHSRLIPISDRFFSTVAHYLGEERPRESSTDRMFVVLKGPNRGRPLTSKGLEQIIRDARKRAGLEHCTCHQLRHTCFTRLREAGMSLEAIQAQAGHRSIGSSNQTGRKHPDGIRSSSVIFHLDPNRSPSFWMTPKPPGS